jgi:hypothetical protein
VITNDVRGVLVGCDDHITHGYNWVKKNMDWDNGCNTCTKKIDEYMKVEDFHIYFYVFDKKSEKPALDSNEYRKNIFGYADIAKVEKNKYPEYDYKHHIKVKNLRLFTSKIPLDDFRSKLEYYDWSNSQIENFGNTLATHGLLLTQNDCEFLQKQGNGIKL